MTTTIRVLGLGNDLLADDAFGVEVVRELRARLPEAVETRLSIASGFALLDDVLEADRLVVVDTIVTGQARPGTVYRFELGQVGGLGQVGQATGDTGVPPGDFGDPAPGSSPHYVGLFETLRLGRELGLRVPREMVILAVEAGDCLTIGGQMSGEMRAAMPVVGRAVEAIVGAWERAAAGAVADDPARCMRPRPSHVS